MPYLNLENHDEMAHLIQLYQAAHPAYQATNDTLRITTGRPETYFMSREMAQDLAAWGRKRHLITKASAERLHETAERLHKYGDPARVVTLEDRVLGTPPRLQPSVRMTQVFRWLYMQETEDDAGEIVCTIEATMAVLRSQAEKAEDDKFVQARAQQLLEWLEDRLEGGNVDV